MRIWFSGPRILGGLIRPGISFGREDGLPALGRSRRPARRARLPRKTREELRAALTEAAKTRSEEMSREDCDTMIDAAMTGEPDANMNLIGHTVTAKFTYEVVRREAEPHKEGDMPADAAASTDASAPAPTPAPADAAVTQKSASAGSDWGAWIALGILLIGTIILVHVASY